LFPAPDYNKLSRDELIDVYENIDGEKHPERLEKVKSLLGLKNLNAEDLDKFEPTGIIETDEVKKAKRIDEFFDSLSESHSEYHRSHSGSDGFSSGGDNGGGCGGGGE
jgi:hypothetical protein